ncbi:MAG TPA: hypothetical protein VFT64_00730 [Rickettsiales bacterium]|nr:hypothetical protein [Rickettsiales bacterium]
MEKNEPVKQSQPAAKSDQSDRKKQKLAEALRRNLVRRKQAVPKQDKNQ